MTKLSVVEVSIDELIPYANNANIHTDEQVEQIANSIEKFGFCDPVGVWKDSDGNTQIVEEHGRVLAARKLGIEKIPVIYLTDLTDEQRRAYTHIHNQLTRNSQFDFQILDMELEELDFNWQEFGFDEFEYNPDDLFEPEGKQEQEAQNESTDEEQNNEDEVSPLICPQCGYVFGKDD